MPLNRPAVWLVAYDIASPRRLNRVRKAVSRLSVPVQYSLYLSLGSQNQVNSLACELERIIDPASDDIRIYRVPTTPEFYRFGLQRCQIPLILPDSFTLGVQQFVHALCDSGHDPAESRGQKLNGPSPLPKELEFLEWKAVSYTKPEGCG